MTAIRLRFALISLISKFKEMKQIISINGRQYLDLNRDIREDEDLSKKSRRLFNEAIGAANNGKTDEAIDLGREALVYARYVKSPQRIFIHNFLAVLHLEKKKFAVAKYHTWQAIADLKAEEKEVSLEKSYLVALQREIEIQELAREHLQPIKLAS